MKRIVFGLLIIAPMICFAQGKEKIAAPQPDLSGTWVLDEARSKTGMSKKDRITDYTLTISHREPEIRMSKRFKQGGREVLDEVVYYMDGRPEYSSLRGIRDPEPVTRWQGQKLVRRSVKEARGPLRLKAEMREEWMLSEGGKALIRTVFNSGPGGVVEFKYVFTRVS